MSMEKISSTLKTIFFVVLLDLIGVGIIIPVFGSLFLQGDFLPVNTPFETRTTLMGVLIALYPLAQFFGAPILGALSDKYGRKPVLLFSLFGTMLGYILFGFGISSKSLTLLFLSRILDGFTAGNISVANSAIADISDEKKRAKYFGMIGMAFGLGFIIGPVLGGLLSDSTLVSWFDFSTPFWFAAALSAINMLFVFTSFSETLQRKNKAIRIHVFTGFQNLKKALGFKSLRVIFAVVFLSLFGFTFFAQFFQVFLIEKFSYTQREIGYVFAYMGLCIALVQGGLVRFLSGRFSSSFLIKVSLFSLSFVIPLLLFANHSWQLFVILPLISLCNGVSMPNLTATVSKSADASSQGEILGINESLRSLAHALPPFIAGFAAAIHVSFPIILASFFILLSSLLFMFFYRPESSKKFHEVSG